MRRSQEPAWLPPCAQRVPVLPENAVARPVREEPPRSRRGRAQLRLRRAACLVALLAFVLPAQAGAHGRGATIALDYRLSLDRATLALPGVRVSILDGDRDLQVSVDRGVSLLIRGELHEPFLRVDEGGVWANGSSPTAAADGVVSAGARGWVHLSGGRSVVWHDHRLAPPPQGATGPDGGFSVPIELDGRPAAIAGTFFRVARPAFWPWLGAGAALTALVGAFVRRRRLRLRLTVALGVGSGLCALTAVTTFAARDAPSGGVAWLQIGTGGGIGLVACALLARLRGTSRAHAAGVLGAVAAAVSASSLSVFWHGVVISALPASLVRLACGVGLLGGASAALISFLPDAEGALLKVRR